MQPGYNLTHTLENRSTISSHVNQTGRVNDSSLSNAMSCNQLHIIYYHEIVREVHKKCMKLQTSSISKTNERDMVLLRIKINSDKAPDIVRLQIMLPPNCHFSFLKKCRFCRKSWILPSFTVANMRTFCSSFTNFPGKTLLTLLPRVWSHCD